MYIFGGQLDYFFWSSSFPFELRCKVNSNRKKYDQVIKMSSPSFKDDQDDEMKRDQVLAGLYAAMSHSKNAYLFLIPTFFPLLHSECSVTFSAGS